MKTACLTPIHQTHTFLVSTLFTKERNERYACHICQKRFNRPSALQTHSYTHTGEKPYACDFQGCGRRFSVVSNLRRHSKVHSRTHSLQRTRLSSDERNIFVQRLINRSNHHHHHESSPITTTTRPNAVNTTSVHHHSTQPHAQVYPPLSRLSVQWLTHQDDPQNPTTYYSY
ncbi:hypothetical protein BC941DRAFT_401341 [Chlamydoabsidia padenii]|nr:hypothetical protein BC941DRAFT_401341 [Chlamydoabsidia padenii]